MPARRLPGNIYGVDFSGAADAGRKIWIAGGVVERGTLVIDKCISAEHLPGSGRGRSKCLSALRQFIVNEKDGIFGLDFPFGLPAGMVREKTWEDFVLAFTGIYPCEEDFRENCRHVSQGRERKRITDIENKTPFSPYNLRVYRQTYFGIRDILYPLVRAHEACVLPMQSPEAGKPWVIEICPASTLKKMHLYMPYKGKGYRGRRNEILEAFEMTGNVSIREREVRNAITGEGGGDALDSFIAAYSTFRCVCSPVINSCSACVEGYVYSQ